MEAFFLPILCRPRIFFALVLSEKLRLVDSRNRVDLIVRLSVSYQNRFFV